MVNDSILNRVSRKIIEGDRRASAVRGTVDGATVCQELHRINDSIVDDRDVVAVRLCLSANAPTDSDGRVRGVDNQIMRNHHAGGITN